MPCSTFENSWERQQKCSFFLLASKPNSLFNACHKHASIFYNICSFGFFFYQKKTWIEVLEHAAPKQAQAKAVAESLKQFFFLYKISCCAPDFLQFCIASEFVYKINTHCNSRLVNWLRHSSTNLLFPSVFLSLYIILALFGCVFERCVEFWSMHQGHKNRK